MAKKLVRFEQLQKLTQGLYTKLHGEVQAHTTAVAAVLEDDAKKIKANADAIKALQDANAEGGAVANAIKEAKDAANAAQADVDALEGKVGTVADGKTVVGLIADAKAQADKGVADAAAAQGTANQAVSDLAAEVQRAKGAEQALAGRLDVIEGDGAGSVNKALADAKDYADGKFATQAALGVLDGRVGTAESDIDTIEVALGKTEDGTIKSVDARIQEAVKGVGDGAIKDAQDDIAALETRMDTAEGKISAVESKAAANQAAIEAINNADTGILKQAKTYADQKVTDLVNGAPEAMDTLNELAQAITDHQTVYDAYVKTVSENLAKKVDATTYDAKVQTLEAADTALQGRAAALETLVGKKAEGEHEATGLVKDVAKNTADIATNAADIDALQAAVGKVTEVAAAEALRAVEGKVTGLETAVGAPAKDGETPTPATGLYKAVADEAARAKGVEAGLDGRVGTLETTVGSAASGLVKDVDDLQKAVTALEGTDHTHANQEELDKFADGDKAALDNAVAKVTGAATVPGSIAEAKKAGDDAQAAVNGLKLGVDLSDDTKAVVQLKDKADAVKSSIEIVYPYEFVTDAEIQAIIDGLGTQA